MDKIFAKFGFVSYTDSNNEKSWKMVWEATAGAVLDVVGGALAYSKIDAFQGWMRKLLPSIFGPEVRSLN